MTTPTTQIKFFVVVAALAACALLVPFAQAKPVEGTTLRATDGAFERAVMRHQSQLSPLSTTVLRASDGAFERAVIQRHPELGLLDYRDAQPTQQQPSGAVLYSDVERQLHLRADTPVATGGSGGSTDWSNVGTFAALGALFAVLAAGAVISMRQRPRPA